MEQQTAVEWLVEKLIKGEFINSTDELIEQAKQMEKEQHDKTAEDWWKEGAQYMDSAGGVRDWETFDKYWEERFKTK